MTRNIIDVYLPDVGQVEELPLSENPYATNAAAYEAGWPPKIDDGLDYEDGNWAVDYKKADFDEEVDGRILGHYVDWDEMGNGALLAHYDIVSIAQESDAPAALKQRAWDEMCAVSDPLNYAEGPATAQDVLWGLARIGLNQRVTVTAEAPLPRHRREYNNTDTYEPKDYEVTK
ncbi:MAG TPA: hypothetical protein VLG11_05140 [Candidatus Saccharimonadales bacterium]|nr:hypothetical protein [Candidatus Saccharimonadales bacterium]